MRQTPLVRANGPEHKSWQAEVVGVMENSLGKGTDAAGAWRHSLLKELHAAGIEVDFNRIP
jgi:hypothetical protein